MKCNLKENIMHFIAKTENTTAQYTRYIVSTITQKLFELSLIKVYEYLYI